MIMNNKCFYLIDKPLNLTSFDVLRVLRKKLQIKKLWHTWTLDPLASGLLLVWVGDYTKLITYLEKADKEYEFTINLDWTTDTLDLEGEINYISEEKKKYFKENLKIEQIEQILKSKFLWKITQTPPKYSALKINWQKALDLVRAWVDFEMKSREITIHNIEILDYNYPKLTLRAFVSSWTYIRTIAWDLWEILWTWGYLSFLRRTKINNLTLKDSQTLDDFEESNVLDIEKLFPKEKYIVLKDLNQQRIDNWLTQKVDLDLIQGEIYFIKRDWFITNVVQKNGLDIKPLKKI